MREGGQESVEEREEEEEARSREGCAAQGGNVSNERVAAGFENHGIIRQIKLERL